MTDEFWNQPEVVAQFAAREPDHRLVELVETYGAPGAIRVLDLGCAGGRNTVFLAERGFDVWAIDASAPMVERTRERLAGVIDPAEADRRTAVGRMDDLGRFAAGSFDLIVALGIFHNARSVTEWEAAVGEAARVLKRGGRLLVNHFTPEADLTGEGVRPVPGQDRLYEGFPGGRTVLMTSDELDAEMAARGLVPEVPSQTVRVATDRGRRVSVNALYRKVGRVVSDTGHGAGRGSGGSEGAVTE